MSDRQRVLEALREAGAAGLFSIDARKRGLSANISQRVRELRDEGHPITVERETWRDTTGKTRPGARYFLHEPDPGLGGGTLPTEDESPQPAAVESGALFAMEPGADYRDPDAWGEAA